MAGTAPPFQAAHLGSLQRAPRPPSAAKTVDRPSIRDRQRSSRVRNRMREICTSGSVGGEDGDVLTYPANERTVWRLLRLPRRETYRLVPRRTPALILP